DPRSVRVEADRLRRGRARGVGGGGRELLELLAAGERRAAQEQEREARVVDRLAPAAVGLLRRDQVLRALAVPVAPAEPIEVLQLAIALDRPEMAMMERRRPRARAPRVARGVEALDQERLG